ncbi:MAG: lysoplasmalogenase [Tannerellaceae bacterium]|jgi:uncharacterized membrane protein YhhN|nr:lysoplasmalogenase [Tannerellaceae bacterium]
MRKIFNTYYLLAIPVVFSVLALVYHDFLFKAGVTGSCILIVLTLGKTISRDNWAIVLAFLFSIAGDWFLSNRHGQTERFIMGIVLFFIAHVGYLRYALLKGRLHYIFTALLLAGYLAFFILSLYPAIPGLWLLASVLAYLLISCLSLGAALGMNATLPVKWIYVFGVSMIVFSDTVIALREFAGQEQLSFLILPTYYLAHISITLSLMKGNP